MGPIERKPDWRDDNDGAKGLKSLLQGDQEQDSEKEGAEVNPGEEPVAATKAQPTKDQVTDKEKYKTAGKEQEAAKHKEVDTKSSTTGGDRLEEQSSGETSSERATMDWRDEKGGAKGLKAELQKGKGGEEGPSANEALISAAK